MTGMETTPQWQQRIEDMTPRERVRHAGLASTAKRDLNFLSTIQDAAVRVAVAQNAKTPPATLAALTTDTFPEVARSAAKNPSTPPEAVAAALPGAHRDYRIAALSRELPPQVALEYATNGTLLDRLTLAAARPNHTEAVKDALGADPDPAVRAEYVTTRLSGAPALDMDVVDVFSRDPDANVRMAVVKHLHVVASTTDMLVRLAGDEDSAITRRLCTNVSKTVSIAPNSRDAARIVEDVLVALSVCPHTRTRFQLVRDIHENLPRRAALNLVKDPSMRVREQLARTCTDPDIWQQLVNDPDPDVREAAAANDVPGAPSEKKVALLTDPDPGVRAVAATRLLDKHTVEVFTDETDLCVLNSARTANLTEEQFQQVMLDIKPTYPVPVELLDERTVTLLGDHLAPARAVLTAEYVNALEPHIGLLPVKVLLAMLKSGHLSPQSVITILGDHPGLAWQTYLSLGDPDPQVVANLTPHYDDSVTVEALVKNPTTPTEWLRPVTDCPQNPFGRASLAAHPNTTADILETIVAMDPLPMKVYTSVATNLNATAATLHVAAGKTTDPRALLNIAHHPSVDPDTLRLVADRTTDEQVLQAVLDNPACPEATRLAVALTL